MCLTQDQSVQHLRVRQATTPLINHSCIVTLLKVVWQDLGLAALESANSSVAEARSGLNQRMSCANECNSASPYW